MGNVFGYQKVLRKSEYNYSLETKKVFYLHRDKEQKYSICLKYDCSLEIIQAIPIGTQLDIYNIYSYQYSDLFNSDYNILSSLTFNSDGNILSFTGVHFRTYTIVDVTSLFSNGSFDLSTNVQLISRTPFIPDSDQSLQIR